MQEADEEARANVEQNVADAIATMPKLKTGLDINVKFTGYGCFGKRVLANPGAWAS
jgi:hypothetical protein